MKEFTPTPDFIQKTMSHILRIKEETPRVWLYSSRRSIAGYAGAAGALLIGIVNLVRLLATLYAPVVCH
jgi:hypothetical protein